MTCETRIPGPWKGELFRFARKHGMIIVLHGAVLVVSTLISVVLHAESTNDFKSYYIAAREFVQGEPERIYDGDYLQQVHGVYPYRYMPAILIFFYIFSFGTFPAALASFNIFSGVCNVSIAFMIYLLVHGQFQPKHQTNTGQDNQPIVVTGECPADQEKVGDKHARNERARGWRERLGISIFLLSSTHIANFLAGQVASVISILLLLGYWFILNKKQYVAGIFIGFSLMFKPIAVFIVPFLFLAKPWRECLKILAGMATTLLPDAIIFLCRPALLEGFLAQNLHPLEGPDVINPSISPSYLISLVTGLPAMWAMLVPLVPAGTLFIATFLGCRNQVIKLILSFTLGILLFDLVYFDIWTSQLVILLPWMTLISSLVPGLGVTRKTSRGFTTMLLLLSYFPDLVWIIETRLIFLTASATLMVAAGIYLFKTSRSLSTRMPGVGTGTGMKEAPCKT